MNLDTVQYNLMKWLDHNFPNTTRDQQLKGVMEELGELCECDILCRVGVDTARMEKLKDAVGDIMVYLLNYCNKADILMKTCIDSNAIGIFGESSTSVMIHLGRLTHADLKHQQGIRGYDIQKTNEEISVNIAGIYFSLKNYCDKMYLEIDECIQVAISEIMQRDWIADPKGGKP